MFSIGWVEILLILLIGLIVIGPDRLPEVVKDIRAAVYAARKAINNAKAELDGEFKDIGVEFEEFREPISKIARIQRMGPKAAITKALFDDDEEFLDSFNPKKIMSGETAGQAYRKQHHDTGDAQDTQPSAQPEQQTKNNPPQNNGGFSWEDVT